MANFTVSLSYSAAIAPDFDSKTTGEAGPARTPVKNTVSTLAILAALCLTAGCVTGTRSISLGVSPADSYSKNPGKGTVAIGTITDERAFENKPDDPSMPSVKGDVKDLTPAARSTYIGRQRNTYGHAMGDIALPAGSTVQGKVAELLGEGLKRRGFELTDPAKADSLVTAGIQRFWSWGTPGFAVLTFEAQISCTVTITRGAKQSTFVVKGYGKNHGQIAKDGNWRETWDIAFADFLANLDQQLASAGQ
jgi:hypothetical protein